MVIEYLKIYSPVHISEQSCKTWREAVEVILDALNERVGKSFKLANDEVSMLLHVLRVLGGAFASKFTKSLGRSEPWR